MLRTSVLCEQQRDSSRSRHREKEDIKITKERTPASEEEAAEWETNREGETVLRILNVLQGIEG